MFPVFDLSRILEWTATTLKDVAKWALMRAFVLSVAFTIVPLALYYGWMFIAEKMITFISGQMGTGGAFAGATVSLSGLGGWVGVHLKIVESFNVIASSASFMFIMRMIKR